MNPSGRESAPSSWSDFERLRMGSRNNNDDDNGDNDPGTIRVIGEAVEDHDPELAVWVARVANSATSQGEAQRRTAVAVRRVVGILDSDRRGQIVNQNLAVQPQYEYTNNNERRLVGYEAVTTLKYETSALDSVNELVDRTLSAGVTSIDSLEFKLSDTKMNQAKSDALRAATKNALKEASAMARELRSRLSAVEHAEESFVSVVMPFNSQYDNARSVSAGNSNGASRISIGKVEVRAKIVLTVSIEQQRGSLSLHNGGNDSFLNRPLREGSWSSSSRDDAIRRADLMMSASSARGGAEPTIDELVHQAVKLSVKSEAPVPLLAGLGGAAVAGSLGAGPGGALLAGVGTGLLANQLRGRRAWRYGNEWDGWEYYWTPLGWRRRRRPAWWWRRNRRRGGSRGGRSRSPSHDRNPRRRRRDRFSSAKLSVNDNAHELSVVESGAHNSPDSMLQSFAVAIVVPHDCLSDTSGARSVDDEMNKCEWNAINYARAIQAQLRMAGFDTILLSNDQPVAVCDIAESKKCLSRSRLWRSVRQFASQYMQIAVLEVHSFVDMRRAARSVVRVPTSDRSPTLDRIVAAATDSAIASTRTDVGIAEESQLANYEHVSIEIPVSSSRQRVDQIGIGIAESLMNFYGEDW